MSTWRILCERSDLLVKCGPLKKSCFAYYIPSKSNNNINICLPFVHYLECHTYYNQTLLLFFVVGTLLFIQLFLTFYIEMRIDCYINLFTTN